MSRKRPPSERGPVAALRRVRSSWQRIGPFLGVSRLQLGLLATGSIAAGLVEASLLALIAAIATALSAGEQRIEVDVGPLAMGGGLMPVFSVGFGLAVLRAALHVFMAYLPARMSTEAFANLRRRLFEAFTDTSWSIQASQRDGYVQSLMGGHVANASQAVIQLGLTLSAFFMFFSLLAGALFISPPIALALMVLSSVLFVAMRPLSRYTRHYSALLSEETTEYSKGMQEVVRLAEERQVFGATESYRRDFQRLIEQVRHPMLRSRFFSRLVPVLSQSVALLILLLALVLVSQLDVSGLASLGAVVLILVRSLSYGQQVQSAVNRMYELTPFMDKLRDAMDHYRANPRPDGSRPMPPVRSVGMVDVRFSYAPGTKVLDGLSFEVRAGEAIGIVGPSGAGKSTVVQLLLRLRDPQEGVLHVDGVDASTIRRADWQRHVAYVPQSPQLRWGTVADNIRFDRPDLTDDDVQRAARLAHIHDDIVSWSDGYDTVIGDRASAVSGGQRQRLCLARALAARPTMLILDEPTSALDVKSEMLIQESLRSLKGEVLQFMVAHRLSTLSICDRVMVIVGGRLQCIDTPERLNIDNEFFREAIEITRAQSGV